VDKYLLALKRSTGMKREISLELGPAQKRVLADEVADILRTAILDGRLTPEQQILEEQVAHMMRVSRGPVREALARLEQEGLVYKLRNRGTFVARLSRADVEEVYTLRRSLELLALEYFMKNASADDVARLEEIFGKISQNVGGDISPKEAADLDIQFHETLVRGARHQRLLEAWLNLREQVRIVLVSRNLANEDFRDLFLDQHRDVLKAVCDRDLERAIGLLANHMDLGYIRLIRTYNTH
jgi:DNA-binding GntR family transcriptional regulator